MALRAVLATRLRPLEMRKACPKVSLGRATVYETHVGQVGMGAHRAGYRPPSPPIHHSLSILAHIASDLQSKRLTRLFLVATRYFVLLGGSTKLTPILT